jgi:transcriptional regulator with XRE-family HTH domain
MDLASYRKSRGLSQHECALELGLRSKGYISGIESKKLTAPLRLALTIERWSGGQVPAKDLNPTAANLQVGVRA